MGTKYVYSQWSFHTPKKALKLVQFKEHDAYAAPITHE